MERSGPWPRLLLALLVLAPAGCRTALGTGACLPRFPYQDQAAGAWLGADSTYSIALSSGRVLWSFQDTFVGKRGARTRAGVTMIGNSVAVSDCAAGAFSVDYHWRADAGSRPRAFYDAAGGKGERFWPQQPWLHRGTLFVPLARIRDAPGEGLGFRQVGVKLARVANPLDPPSRWRIDYADLTDRPVVLGVAVVVRDGVVHLFGSHQRDQILARAPADALAGAAPAAHLATLAADGDWRPGLVPESARKLGLPASSGLTVRFHPGLRRYLALFMDTRAFPGPTVAVSTAPDLGGPWSPPLAVYSVPEMDPRRPGHDRETFCYGAYEHPALNPDPAGTLLFTYTCNSFSFAKVLANLEIYTPRAVRIPLPRALVATGRAGDMLR